MQSRVLVVMLAEATFDLIMPLAKAGKLPTFSRLMATGGSGTLQSQMPMVTPQMCGTIVTGRSPGQHGLMDFYQRGNDGKFKETDGSALKAPPVWRILSDAGVRCGILNVPFTFPPEKINGFLIAGEDAPGAHPSIAYPREVFEEVTQRFGPYPLKDTFPGGRDKTDYLTLINRDIERQSEIYEYLLKSKPWEFAITFFSHTAMVQHYFWADHLSTDPANIFKGVVESAYVGLDTAIDKLVRAAGEGATVFVISDSGAGPLSSGVNINQYLEQQGFLARTPGYKPPTRATPGAHSTAQVKSTGGTAETLRRTVQKILRGPLKPLYFTINYRLRPLKAWIQSHLSGSSIDWSKTRAYSRGQWGYIYINCKGRDPHGIVAPGADYDAVCAQIAAAFEKLIDPATGEKAASRVWRRDELYHGPMVELAPDIVIDWKNGAYMPNEASRGDSVFAPRFREYMSWPTSGSHRLGGVLIAAGPKVLPGSTLQGARIIDLMPTWLHLMGQKIPGEVEGKVIPAFASEQAAT